MEGLIADFFFFLKFPRQLSDFLFQYVGEISSLVSGTLEFFLKFPDFPRSEVLRCPVFGDDNLTPFHFW